MMLNNKIIYEIIDSAFQEDIGEGDHTSLATIPESAKGKAKLLVKDEGIIAGVELAEMIFNRLDPHLEIEVLIKDGTHVKKGDIVFYVLGSSRSIVSAERLVLNFMQRMSGIATKTFELSNIIQDTSCKLLDTRKTTPGIRYMEKWAVRIGGGMNHRYALYDMVMIKDNHVDYAGGIRQAIERTVEYLGINKKNLKIEIEVRNFEELNEVLEVGQVDRIMLDNFSPENLQKALAVIDGRFETEASGGIDENSILSYAKTGVDYISSGAITHSFKSLDMSLKAEYFH